MAKKKSSTRRNRSAGQKTASPQEGERINKVLAQAGFGSRREVEELVVQGRVEVDRETITKLSTRVDPSKQKIKVDGVPLKKQKLVYFALNKPPGVLSTNRDPSGRLRVIDFVPANERVFSVGRLDRSSEGLILLTNDGSLAQRLAHPKYRIQKSYFVVVAGMMTNDELAGLRKGVHLAEGFARIDGARIRRHRKGCTELEIVLSEGKNREIRRILARAGHKVVLLRRIAIGTLRLGQIPVGASRALTANEVKSLYALATPSPKKASKPASKAKPASASGTKRKSAPTVKKTDVETNEMDDEFIAQPFASEGDSDGFEWSPEEDFDGSLDGGLPSLGDTPEEEFAYDDDFVSGFDFSSSQGSVIGGENEETPTPKPRGTRAGGRTARSSKSSGGKRTASKSPSKSARGGASASRTARGTSKGVKKAAGGRKSSHARSTGGKSPGGKPSSAKSSGGKSNARRTTKSSPSTGGKRSGAKAGPPKGRSGRPGKGRRR